MVSRSRHLYLASQSPRRSEILTRLGLPYTLIPNLLSEERQYSPGEDISSYLKELSYQKAISSVASYKGLVLGMDTLVVLEGQIYGKPSSISVAIETLKKLSSQRHQVYSSLTVLDTISDTRVDALEVNNLQFKSFSDAVIKEYCDNYEVLDKAGAYGIQDSADIFLQDLEGSIDSVMGVPVNSLLKIIKDYDIVKV